MGHWECCSLLSLGTWTHEVYLFRTQHMIVGLEYMLHPGECCVIFSRYPHQPVAAVCLLKRIFHHFISPAACEFGSQWQDQSISSLCVYCCASFAVRGILWSFTMVPRILCRSVKPSASPCIVMLAEAMQPGNVNAYPEFVSII